MTSAAGTFAARALPAHGTTWLVGIVVAGSLGSVADGQAQCSYTTLTSGVTQTVPATGFHQFTQPTNYWSAVAVRSAAGDDWDLHAYSSTDAYPACVSDLLASSAAFTGVDLIVGDFNHNAFGTYYLDVRRYSGAGAGTVEWDDGADILAVNGPAVTRVTGTGDVVEIWDVYLEAGKTYRFDMLLFQATNMSLLVFQNPASSPYWVGRGAQVYTLPGGPDTFTAPATDWYGVAVVNEDGTNGQYVLQVGTCEEPAVLASTVSAYGNAVTQYYAVPQNAQWWTAVGVRSVNGVDDWDLEAYSQRSGQDWPWCFDQYVAGSNTGGAEFVVGDFNSMALDTFYVRPFLWSGPNGGAVTEWDDGTEGLTVNGTETYRPTGPTDVLEMWDIALEAGQQYDVLLGEYGADMKVFVFANPGGGAYWAGRANAVFSTSTSATFTPASSGIHGLLAVNDNGGTGDYFVGVNACFPPFHLLSGLASNTRVPHEYAQFTQSGVPYWTAVATRADNPTEDWDVYVSATATGNPAPICFGPNLASSGHAPGIADVVVGDFNHNPYGTYYARTQAWTPGAFAGKIEWDSGSEQITPNSVPVQRATGLDDIVEIWDVFLEAGQTYTIFFEREGTADTRFLLFHNPGATYWTLRGNEVLTAFGHAPFTAPATDWYGLAVVNDNGGAGTYRIGVYTSGVDVPRGDVPVASVLRGVTPNPATGPMQFAFELAAPARIGFEVVDVAGRAVGHVPARSWEAGRWSVAWDGQGVAGRVAAGVYFVRMTLDDRPAGLTKLVLLQ